MIDTVLENRPLLMMGTYRAPDLMLKCAVVEEGLSTLTRTTMEFLSKDKALDLKNVVGYTMNMVVPAEKNVRRKFLGTCVSAEYLGLYQGYAHFTAEVRPWLWFLTLRHDNRIFQAKSVIDIIKEVFRVAEFTDYQVKTTGTYPKRDYCVQYRESDYAFICRLMEEEGIYFYFTHQGERETLVLADGIGAHAAAPNGPSFEFHFREKDYRRRTDHIFEWAAAEAVTPGRVALTDWNFETPTADLKQIKAIPKGSHARTTMEIYDYPGNYRAAATGEGYVKAAMEAQAVQHQRWTGVGNVRTLGVGQTFQLSGHPRTRDTTEFLMTRATHYLQIETEYAETDNSVLSEKAMQFVNNDELYRIVFDAIPKSVQFRAPKVTPWPSISGLHTALVVGPDGEEIHTDSYGRIKVKFHWDRNTKNDDSVSCWVRTVMPWTGKGWGMIAVPRIGQEVVIQFEEGNPDRPICTGMLYKQDTMPPYTLPANKTQTGIKTRSSKSGSETTFNELMFEDLKDSELVRFQSEKDYKQIIKNNAEITIGIEKKDKGDLTQTIYRHKTETLKTGDMTFTVEAGNETRDIKKNKTETVGENNTLTIKKNSTVKVEGNLEEKVTGNHKAEVTGNHDCKVTGNFSNKVTGTITEEGTGGITIKSPASIKLEVGGSSIELTQAGVTIKGMTVQVDGKMLSEVKGGITLVLKGGLTLIN